MPRNAHPFAIPVPIITKRLEIRPLRLDDAEAMWNSINASRVELSEWMPWPPTVRSVADVEGTVGRFIASWESGSDHPLGIFLRDSGMHVGGTGYHRANWAVRSFELGYWIRTDHVGQGLATECVAGLTDHAFTNLHARRVEIRMDPRNTRSRAIPVRLGFEHEGTLRSNSVAPDGSIRDTDVFARIA